MTDRPDAADAPEASGAEERFVARTGHLHWQADDLRAALLRLDDWLAALAAACAAAPLAHTGLAPGHALAAQAIDLNRQLAERVPAWLRGREELQAAQAVAGALDRQAIFLVFGKFNAGKSSLCNFIANRFAARGQAVRYFRIEAGRVVTTDLPFKEGATETTRHLQGVFLGPTLVLLDTPGLHSVTPENAELTQRFTDSADGVLWLTASASPGQVQELDELARELRRAKPLLPVVSRSDYLEEDELDGEIVKVLRNKSAETRLLQEADVKLRGREKLRRMGVDGDLLQSPVSVSVYAAQDPDGSETALRDAGFDRFWSAFSSIVGPALEYKQRKHAEIIVHHAEENVLHDLQHRIMPGLNRLLKAAAEERSSLDERRAWLLRRIWRSVIPELPALLERHAGGDDAAAMRQEISLLLANTCEREARLTLPDYRFAGAAARFDFEAASPENRDAALEKSIYKTLDTITREMIGQCRHSIGLLESGLGALQGRIHGCQADLIAIKTRVRHPGNPTRDD